MVSLEMDQEDESDEDERFLHSASEIVEEISKGGEVSPLMERLKVPTHSFDEGATKCIYNLIKEIEHGIKRDPIKSFSTSRSLSSCFDSFSTEKELSISPIQQIASNLEHSQEITRRVVPIVPRLSLDSPSSLSIYRSPLSSTDMLPGNSRCSCQELYSNCKRKFHKRRGILNPSDFLYLLIFVLGAFVIFYYLYFPPLYKDPVF